VSATLTDTQIKLALELEVKAHRKPAKRNQLFRAATIKRYGNHCRGVQTEESSEEEDNSECFCSECAGPYSVKVVPVH
jgi:hypothetical protein